MILNICNAIIEYSFYALFFFVPLTFASNTSELFEFNKMWVTFSLTLIAAASWITKIILQKKIVVQKTPLDIPIFIFLGTHILATIISLDQHVSVWGYYSRFNGGLLSIMSYIFLYYAFVSNTPLAKKVEENLVIRYLPQTTLLSATWIKIGFTAVSILLILFGFYGAYPRLPSTQGMPAMLIGMFCISFFLLAWTTTGSWVKRTLSISLITGAIVIAWGIPSHFGYDPTCLLIRGNLDVSCWTESFQPRVRIFATLGQPNWMAAYLAILLPIALAFGLNSFQSQNNAEKKYKVSGIKYYVSKKNFIRNTLYLLLATAFYLAILFTDSRSGFLGLLGGLLVFAALLGWLIFTRLLPKQSLLFFGIFLLIAFLSSSITGRPHPAISYKSIISRLAPSQAPQNIPPKQQETPKAIGPALEVGGTDSGKIRRIVWQGAIDIWKANPLFGTGVETFAFAYYKYRPAEHNRTSEWDYLYNKAHNEFLNYLATTGLFGFGSYVAMIGLFLWTTINKILQKVRSSDILRYRISDSPSFPSILVSIALLAAYISILVSNFLGFSVVIVNIYLFLIPAFVFVHSEMLNPQKVWIFPKETVLSSKYQVSSVQWISIVVLLCTISYMLYTLHLFWRADVSYALGYNLNKVGNYQQANPLLSEAISLRGDEPQFIDEFAVNNSILSVVVASQKDESNAKTFLKNAVRLSTEVVTYYPNNVVYWKSRVRIFNFLSQLNPQYLTFSLEAIQKAAVLAPTDAKIAYNLGILYGQTGNSEKAVQVLESTVKLKANYRDAFYALGLFYHELAVNEKEQVINQEYQQKAIATMHYILKNLNPDDPPALQALKTWGVPISSD